MATWRSVGWPQLRVVGKHGLLGRWKATVNEPVSLAVVDGLTTTR